MPPKTVDALRRMVDRGQTRGKVAFNDPAAAPLGTDEEAAGTPIAESELRAAARTEIVSPPRPVTGGSEPPFWPRAAGTIIGAAVLAIVLWSAFWAF